MRTPALAAFSIGVAWMAYVYAGYPLLLALVALVARVRPKTDEGALPAVAVLISARNEEKDIGWKIAETLAWDYPADRLEVLVASDASEDRTDEIVKAFDDPRVVLVRMDKRGGKNRALNVLAQRARGELLFFTDANSHIDPGCLRLMVRHFADPRVGSVTGNSYSWDGETNPAQETGATVYWGHELLIKRLENRFGSVLCCDGAIFCIRRPLYTPVLPDLANDLELPLRIGHAGYWTRYESQARVLEKDTSSPAEEFQRRRRICGQGALAMWKLRETLHGWRGWQFLSQKVLRWLTLVPMVLLLVSSAAMAGHAAFAAMFGLQLVCYTAAAIGWMRRLGGKSAGRLFSVPLYVTVSAVGAFMGVVDALSGKRYDIWESPALSRGRDTVVLGGSPAAK